MDHGRWTEEYKLEDDGSTVSIWMGDPDGVLGISDNTRWCLMLDIFYLTYKHDYSKENFERIKEIARPGQNVLHVADIEGIYNAHKECALQSSTSHFFVVDGDAWIDDEFDFSYVPSTTDEVYPETCSAQCTHVWRAINPATRRAYGYGGVKLFAREAL